MKYEKTYSTNNIVLHDDKYLSKALYDKDNHIRAVYDSKSIRVYQAFNHKIADQVLEDGIFGTYFNRNRMTWIKTSFLWMMYRSGWATKENQERILAIEIKRDAFDYLVNKAVSTKYDSEEYGSVEEWKRSLNESDIRIQWDPERDIYGNPLDYRSIQIGIKGELVEKYLKEWIIRITDITDYVTELRMLLVDNKDISELLPKEVSYTVRLQ
ncbi:MAG: DUF4291 domain-containing protein [Pseudobutyrivibrio sp.]|nr:DUF4291 domain-containing protein [Pseudobutyrivibrio sp.]